MNKFQHQHYPTTPQLIPVRQQLSVDEAADFDFDQLHASLGVSKVLLVHGTFMGNDPFGIADVLKSLAESMPILSNQIENLANAVLRHTRPLMAGLADDIGNYTAEFCDLFRQLAGPDPQVELLHPTWTGQNHHVARADLAVRILDWLLNQSLNPDDQILLWGHSHAGNGFALVSNLLANDHESVQTFFQAAGDKLPEHWIRVRSALATASSPHPLASHLLVAAFGTPVRYGWDQTGLRSLIHVLHDCCEPADDTDPLGVPPHYSTHPLFPAHSLPDILTARYGDWVQAFAIAGTDTSTPTSITANERLGKFLEQSLPAPAEEPSGALLDPLRMIPTGSLRQLCQRWKTGTRCHSTGLNLLVNYQPSGQSKLGIPLEQTIMGHGVATTKTWLPAHLKLVIESLMRLQSLAAE